MTQTRFDDYAAPDTSARFNEKLRGILRQGVYAGFTVGVGANGGVAATRRLSIRMDPDPDISAVDSGTNGATGLDGGGNPRRLTSAANNFLTTVAPGDVLWIDEPVSGSTADNGKYLIVDVVSDTQLDVERDWPSGGALVNLNFTVHDSIGYLRTPDGVIVKEDLGKDNDIDAGFTLQHAVGGARDRIDLVVARYVYNASTPANNCTYRIIQGVVATGIVDNGINGVTGDDASSRPRRLTSAGQNFLTTCATGYSLTISEPAPNDADNGTYKIVTVVSDTELDVDRDWPSGGGLVGLIYSVTDVPVAPAITDNDVILASVYVAAGAATITNADITNVEKIDLYAASTVTNILNNRSGIFRPGVYSGFNLRQGTLVTDVTIDPGGLLTPQYYLHSEPAALVDEVTLALAGAGTYRYDWVICVHKTDSGLDPYYMVVTGTATAVASEAPRPTDAEIITAMIADPNLDMTYNSMDYVTKLGYMEVTQTTVDYFMADKVIVPPKLHVTEGSYDGPNYSHYFGPAGLQEAIDDYHAIFSTANAANSYNTGLMDSATGIYSGAKGEIIAEGRFNLPAPLRIPSGIVVRGGGVPLSLHSVATTGFTVEMYGYWANYNGGNNIFAGSVAPGGGFVPANHTRYTLEIDTLWYNPINGLVNRFSAGDYVEMYSPTPATVYSIGWVESIQSETEITVVMQQSGAQPDPTVHADISMRIIKHDFGIENAYLERGARVYCANRASLKNLNFYGSGSLLQASISGDCVFEDLAFEGTGVTICSITSGTDAMSIAGGNGGDWIGGRYRISNIIARGAAPTISVGGYQSHISGIYLPRSTGFIYVANADYVHAEHLVAPLGMIDIISSDFGYYSDLQGPCRLRAPCADNVITNHDGGTLDLQAGITRTKVYFSSGYTDNSGLTTNIHYYDVLQTIEPNYLRRAFSDIIEATDNTSLTDNANTNPASINLADGRGLYGVEHVHFGKLVPAAVSGYLDNEGGSLGTKGDLWMLEDGDPRFRFYGSGFDRGSYGLITAERTTWWFTITAVMTGMILRVSGNSVGQFNYMVDGGVPVVATPVTYQAGSRSLAASQREVGYPYAITGLSQDLHTITVWFDTVGITVHTFEGVDIINEDTVNRNITELAAADSFSDRGMQSLTMDSNVALPTYGAKGGRLVRYVRDSDGTRQWAVTNLPIVTTTVNGVVGGGAAAITVVSTAGVIAGDMIRVNDTDLYYVTSLGAGTFNVYPNTPGGGYAGGEPVVLYAHTYRNATVGVHATNMELQREHNFREFGNGTVGADFARLNSTNVALLAWTLYDNTTSLMGVDVFSDADGGSVGDDVGAVTAMTNRDTLNLTAVGDYVRVNFVGSGLGLRRGSTIPTDYLRVIIDGVDVTATVVANGLFGDLRDYAFAMIVSDLPYGSHTVELYRSGAGAGASHNLDALSFLVFVPKEPSYSGTPLYETFALDTTASIVTSPATGVTTPTIGAVRYDVARNWWWNSANWVGGQSAAARMGTTVQTATNLIAARFYYWGTKCVVWGNQGTLSGAGFQIDGAGAFSFNSLVGPVVEGLHYIDIVKAAADATTMDAVDVITKVHAPTLPSYVLGEASIFSNTLYDRRPVSPYDNNSYIVRGCHSRLPVKYGASNAFGATAFYEPTGHQLVFNSKGGPVQISGMLSIDDNADATNVQLVVDGVYVWSWSYGIYVNSLGTDVTVSFNEVIHLPRGRHCVNLVGLNATGCSLNTVTMTVKEFPV